MGTSIMDSELAARPRPQGWSADAVYFEYTRAANPIADGAVSPVPIRKFGRELYAEGPTRVVPLDLSAELGWEGPATSPALCANFVRIEAGDRLPISVNATSQLYYVLDGQGWSSVGGERMEWGKGDFLALPAGCRAEHHAEETACFYWVHDEPLLRYLGATATEARFRPTRYPAADARAQLDAVASDPSATDRNRVSILLANRSQDQTLTITHVLWTMFGILPEGQFQPPHRHQSVALDLVLDCQPGCYTLLGNRDEEGNLVDVERVDWEPGAAFVTPPGMWHSHHNESGADAFIIPIQDAGVQTYLRALDIRFMGREEAARAMQTAWDISPQSSMSPVTGADVPLSAVS